jgi:hypothetical protein
MSQALERRANNALGVCLICVVFMGESVVAHHVRPNAASPFVWGALGLTAAACLVYYLKYRARPKVRVQ